MTDHYQKCKICGAVICNPYSEGRQSHFEQVHPSEANVVLKQKVAFDCEYERLKEKYPKALRGFMEDFEGVDKYSLTATQKRDIKASKFLGFKIRTGD